MAGAVFIRATAVFFTAVQMGNTIRNKDLHYPLPATTVWTSGVAYLSYFGVCILSASVSLNDLMGGLGPSYVIIGFFTVS